MIKTALASISLLALLVSCEPSHQPLEFTVEGDRIVAVGTIDASAMADFLEVAENNPEVGILLLRTIDGSVDDEANLEFSRAVREMGFDTIVPSDGLVASGGTDLFLAGNRRTLEPGACVGVHSWGDGGPPATDLPRNHSIHAEYLDYYRDLGVNTEFYWFTLEAATVDEMHWMTAIEADRFEMSTDPSPELGSSGICEMR